MIIFTIPVVISFLILFFVSKRKIKQLEVKIKEKEVEFEKERAIAELLELDLKCPHCNEVLEKADERKERQRKEQ